MRALAAVAPPLSAARSTSRSAAARWSRSREAHGAGGARSTSRPAARSGLRRACPPSPASQGRVPRAHRGGRDARKSPRPSAATGRRLVPLAARRASGGLQHLLSARRRADGQAPPLVSARPLAALSRRWCRCGRGGRWRSSKGAPLVHASHARRGTDLQRRLQFSGTGRGDTRHRGDGSRRAAARHGRRQLRGYCRGTARFVLCPRRAQPLPRDARGARAAGAALLIATLAPPSSRLPRARRSPRPGGSRSFVAYLFTRSSTGTGRSRQ